MYVSYVPLVQVHGVGLQAYVGVVSVSVVVVDVMSGTHVQYVQPGKLVRVSCVPEAHVHGTGRHARVGLVVVLVLVATE